ncbi:MAG: DUF4149 domain-containing protein [Pseudomonadota bacterium]
MQSITGFLGLGATSLVFGAILFFSVIVAPTVFRTLEAKTAATFIRAIFPWYYVYLTLVAAIGGLALSVSPGAQTASLVMFLVAVLGVKARYVLLPRINTFRDAMLAGDQKAQTWFNLLHRSSVILNVIQLFLAGAALYLLHQA